LTISSEVEEPSGRLPARTTLRNIFRARFTVVWFLLIAATLVSWRLGSANGISNHRLATVAILVIAFIKVRFVGLDFMELRGAPRALRLVFAMYCLIVGSALVFIYLVGPMTPH
jgi:Prokaryotic Cytochrome C oxidase subunit IV